METYGTVFSEIRYEVAKVAFLNAFLSAAIVFFAGNVIGTMLQYSYWYNLLPAGVVFLFSFIRQMRRYSLRRLEERNPEVSEILRTAHDNCGRDTLMVHALFVELLEKMETVSAGVFLNAGRTTLKLLLIAFLAFTPLLVVNYAPFLVLDQPLTQLGLGGLSRQAQQAIAPIIPVDDAPERDLTGDKDIIELGNEKLDITAGSSQGGVDFTNPEDAVGRGFTYNDYPEQVGAEQTTAGTGGTLAEGDLINDYSCRVKGTCAPTTN